MNSMEDKHKNIKDAEVVTNDSSHKETPKTDSSNPKKEAGQTDTTTTETKDSGSSSKDTTAATVAPEAAATTAATEATKTSSARFPLLPFIAGVLTALLAWQLYSVITNEQVELSDSGYPEPVALVNGTAVDQQLFEQNVTETLAAAEAQGLDIADETVRTEVESQALEVIINTRLLVAAATKAGYQVTDEEIATRIGELEEQFGGAQALDAELEQLGLDREELATDVREQLSVDALLEEEVLTQPITVTDEEVAEVYESLQTAGQEMPPLASVKDAIVAQIEQQKQQGLIENYLEELRAAADIEINL